MPRPSSLIAMVLLKVAGLGGVAADFQCPYLLAHDNNGVVAGAHLYLEERVDRLQDGL